MKYITLRTINIIGNRCEFEFEYPKELETYIEDKSKKLYFKLPSEYNVESIPKSILAVPFVGSVLCVSMLCGLGIKVPTLDKTFYESISSIEEAFNKMYPYTNFQLIVQADEIIDCNYVAESATTVFFTGGVDATSALIEIIDKKPTLVNIWGGDLLLSDTSGREALENYISTIASQIGLKYIITESNCRRFFNEQKIETLLRKQIRQEDNHGWWASIAHILSMTSAIAPLLYQNRVGVHYIGSTYPAASEGFDANNIDMVNAIKIAGCHFEPVDEKLERSDKVHKIVDYSKNHHQKFELKVCWFSTASENCSHCEKCYRTIVEILSCHGDPNEFGFKIDKRGYHAMHNFLKYNYINKAFWEANRSAFLAEYDYWKKDRNISWILDIKFNNKRRIECHRSISKIKGRIYRATHKLLRKLISHDEEI